MVAGMALVAVVAVVVVVALLAVVVMVVVVAVVNSGGSWGIQICPCILEEYPSFFQVDYKSTAVMWNCRQMVSV